MNNFNHGNCKHEPWVAKPGDEDSPYLHLRIKEPVVMLANDGDPFYATEYNSWDEVNDLIAQLKQCATEAFGEEPPVGL